MSTTLPTLTCPAELIETKNKLHVDWFALQKGAVRRDGHTLLDRFLLADIGNLGSQAAAAAARCEVSPEIQGKIAVDLAEFDATLKDKELTKKLGRTVPRTPLHFIFNREDASTLITDTINRLANDVHHAGYDLLEKEPSKNYAGCVISASDLRALDAGTLTFCEGAVPSSVHGYHARIVSSGTGLQVEQTLGVHRTAWRFKETEEADAFDVEGEWIETPGDRGWEARGQGVTNILESLGLKVNQEGNTYLATGRITGKAHVRAIAYWLASLWGVAISPDEECVQDSVAEAWDYASEHSKKHGAALWQERTYSARDEHECDEDRDDDDGDDDYSSRTGTSTRAREIEDLRAGIEELLDQMDKELAREWLQDTNAWEESLYYLRETPSIIRGRISDLRDIASSVDADDFESQLDALPARVNEKIDAWFKSFDYLDYLRHGKGRSNLCGAYLDFLERAALPISEISDKNDSCSALWSFARHREDVEGSLARAETELVYLRDLAGPDSGVADQRRMQRKLQLAHRACLTALDTHRRAYNLDALEGICATLLGKGLQDDARACNVTVDTQRLRLAHTILDTLDVCRTPILTETKRVGLPDNFGLAAMDKACGVLAQVPETADLLASCKAFVDQVRAVNEAPAATAGG